MTKHEFNSAITNTPKVSTELKSKCNCSNPVHGKAPNEPHVDGCSIQIDSHDVLCLWCDKGCKKRGES